MITAGRIGEAHQRLRPAIGLRLARALATHQPEPVTDPRDRGDARDREDDPAEAHRLEPPVAEQGPARDDRDAQHPVDPRPHVHRRQAS